MAKIKSKEFISSDSESDSDDEVQAESSKSEPKGEKRKSTDPGINQETSKKQKTDSDEVPKKKEPEKNTKNKSESESESSDDEEKKKEPAKKEPAKKEPAKKEPEKNTKKQSSSESESSDEEAKKKKAKKEKKKKLKEKSKSKEKEKKKPPKTTVSKKPEGNARKGFDLGRDRKISVSEFRGKRYVNIREYYDAGGGDMKPGKRGTSLNREQWDMLTQVKDEVNKAVASDNKFWDLGNNKRVSLNEFKGNVFFDIREYYEKDGEMKPGKKGISLSREQWNGVHAVTEEITDTII